jgi:hypothetical protein
MLRRRIYPFLLLLALITLLSGCSTATAQGNDLWISLSEANLPGLRSQLQQKYSSDAFLIDAGRMRVLRIKAASPLYLVDTRVTVEPQQRSLNPTCGTAGCALVGFAQSGKEFREVLSVYLDPVPPEGKPLVETATTTQNGLPCLNFNQRQRTTKQIEVVEWCYDGQRYQFTSSSVHQQ